MFDTNLPTVLQSESVSKSFGGVKVVNQVSFNVKSREVVGIIGPNGAGKTTLMNLLSGSMIPLEGKVCLLDLDVTLLDISKRCKLGLAKTHQIPKPFNNMTVFENVLVAAFHGHSNSPSDPTGLAWQVLEKTKLEHVANRPADTLGHLDRKRLELSRALATKPKILLLDEIGGGLTDGEGNILVDLIHELREMQITIVWIEHIVRLLLDACSRLICMADGKLIADGIPTEVVNSTEVKSAYFGKN